MTTGTTITEAPTGAEKSDREPTTIEEARTLLRANFILVGKAVHLGRRLKGASLTSWARLWRTVFQGDTADSGVPAWFYENVGANPQDDRLLTFPKSVDDADDFSKHIAGTMSSFLRYLNDAFGFNMPHKHVQQIASVWGDIVKHKNDPPKTEGKDMFAIVKSESAPAAKQEPKKKAAIGFPKKANLPPPPELLEPIEFTGDETTLALFLKLTQRTCPTGHEDALYGESLGKLGFVRDPHGNYFKIINHADGSEPVVMFACHMDTADHGWPKPVTHTKNGTTIGTDKKTILGADDKAGMTVIIKMVKANVPGVYFCFRAEEVGCIGSEAIAKNWKHLTHVISFDRRGYTSIVTHQRGERCCSDDFANELALRLNAQSRLFNFKADDSGISTDSRVFAPFVPECTNISVGYFDEHHKDEEIDMMHLEDVVNAAQVIDWHTLPVERDPNVRQYRGWSSNYTYNAKIWNKEESEGETLWPDEDELQQRYYDYHHSQFSFGTRGSDDDGDELFEPRSTMRKELDSHGEPFLVAKPSATQPDAEYAEVYQHPYHILTRMVMSGELTPKAFILWQTRYPWAALELAFQMAHIFPGLVEDLAAIEPDERKFFKKAT